MHRWLRENGAGSGQAAIGASSADSCHFSIPKAAVRTRRLAPQPDITDVAAIQECLSLMADICES